jgi:hypothetical protein
MAKPSEKGRSVESVYCRKAAGSRKKERKLAQLLAFFGILDQTDWLQ